MSHTDSKPVLGIVGGIASGKSLVAAALESLGCHRIDADRIGHELLERLDIRGQIRGRFGDSVFTPDGSVDRSALGDIVFADPDALEALQQILHPRMRERMARQIDDAQSDPDAPAIVLDAAVLFEAGWDDLCTHTVFVDCPRPLRLERIETSGRLSAAELEQREASQIPLDKKRALCSHVLVNQSSVSHLNDQAHRLLSQILPPSGASC